VLIGLVVLMTQSWMRRPWQCGNSWLNSQALNHVLGLSWSVEPAQCSGNFYVFNKWSKITLNSKKFGTWNKRCPL